jgi:hypothetical protein
MLMGTNSERFGLNLWVIWKRMTHDQEDDYSSGADEKSVKAKVTKVHCL